MESEGEAMMIQIKGLRKASAGGGGGDTELNPLLKKHLIYF